jgi:hypothetical protein
MLSARLSLGSIDQEAVLPAEVMAEKAPLSPLSDDLLYTQEHSSSSSNANPCALR